MNLPALGWLSPACRARPLVGLVLMLAACENTEPTPGPEGPDGPQGDPGIGGPQGGTGPEGFATLIDAVHLDRGGECAYGGTRYDMGLDNGENGGTARDGILQGGEINHSSVVCNASGTVVDWAVPGGAPGTATIDASGGNGNTTGGYGGVIAGMLIASGGHVQAYNTGFVDTSFSLVAATPQYGAEKLTITNGQIVTPTVFPLNGDTAVGDGIYYTFTNGVSTYDDGLYVKRAGLKYRVTGIEIQAGGILTVPVDTFNGEAILTFTNDIRNAGTITTPLNVRDRFSLILAAHHYFGDATGTIDLKGGDGGGSTTGGIGGNLLLALTTGINSISSDAVNNNYGDSSCPVNYGDGSGGFYNAGTIDITQGALGNGQPPQARYINVCASDEIQNTGNLTALGRGSGKGGGIQLTGGEGRTSNSGVLDVRGGPGLGVSGGGGGYVALQGASVVAAGHVRSDGSAVPTSTSCEAAPCVGGNGGQYYVGSFGGPVWIAGQVDLQGGDAVGSGIGAQAVGGGGGTLFVQSWDGYDSVLDANIPAGDIFAMPTVDVSGGSGGATGGQGGNAQFAITGGEGVMAFGQSVSLQGYASFDLSGGSGGATGGYGGEYMLVNGDGFYTLLGSCCGAIPTGATSGAAVNTVPVDLSGGSGGTGMGGSGGTFNLWAHWPSPMLTGEVVNRAAVDLTGGGGKSGGYGGEAWFVASGMLENSGTIDVSGANSSDGLGGGGYAGPIDMVSQYDRVGSHATLTSNGGSGSSAGDGAFTTIVGREADITGNVTSNGGAGNVSNGTGGEGGHVEVWSADTFSVVTGTISSSGGAGFTTRGSGTIVIDGYVEQARGGSQ